MYEDKTLICKDCGKEFIFTAGEQEFYAEKGFENEPVRCKECRAAKKRQSKLLVLCTMPYAQTAVLNAKCRLSRKMTALFIAASALQNFRRKARFNLNFLQKKVSENIGNLLFFIILFSFRNKRSGKSLYHL